MISRFEQILNLYKDNKITRCRFLSEMSERSVLISRARSLADFLRARFICRFEPQLVSTLVLAR